MVYERTEPFDNSHTATIEVADVRKYGKTYVSLLRRRGDAADGKENGKKVIL